jgi:mRNA degradation ribonuclease J1/J2
VFLTHFHLDHTGRVPTLWPRAEFIFGKANSVYKAGEYVDVNDKAKRSELRIRLRKRELLTQLVQDRRRYLKVPNSA